MEPSFTCPLCHWTTFHPKDIEQGYCVNCSYWTRKEDGAYQVTWEGGTAGFIIKDGQVTDCAPILRRNLKYWFPRASKVDLPG